MGNAKFYTLEAQPKEFFLQKKIIKLMGGLGNQMFQYAFAFVLAKKFGTQITLDLSWFENVKTSENVTSREFDLDVFNLDYESATQEDLEKIVRSDDRSIVQKLLWKAFKVKKYNPQKNAIIQKVGYNFDKNLLSSSKYYYCGYFQNEKYFVNEREELLKCFSSKLPLDEKTQGFLNQILATNSVSIHVRRGDYVTLECVNKFHGTCGLDYYQKAIEYIAKHVKNPHFFLFSDDIDWVIKNLKIEHPFTVVDSNQEKGWLDLELMKQCKHNIVANSSFSWWGAWLNENPQKIVIAPKKWNTKSKNCKIIPNEWIKL